MSTVSENIRNLRMMRGISQKQLGSTLHKSANAISNWEKGFTSPDVEILETICNVLEVTPNQIYGWDPCPELEEFISRKKEILDQMDDLIRQRAELDDKIRAYSDELRRKSKKK